MFDEEVDNMKPRVNLKQSMSFSILFNFSEVKLERISQSLTDSILAIIEDSEEFQPVGDLAKFESCVKKIGYVWNTL